MLPLPAARNQAPCRLNPSPSQGTAWEESSNKGVAEKMLGRA